MSDVTPPLPQAAGYGVVVGLGVAFALGKLSLAYNAPFTATHKFDRHDLGYARNEEVLQRRQPINRNVRNTPPSSPVPQNLHPISFMVANRSVGVGLTAAAVISSWLYSTALLGASLLTYKYGVALGVWWGASASTMVCFLAFISIEAKRRAPNAHTLLELIKVRYGKGAHILWIVFCLVNNLLVFSSMLLGASTAVTSLTGMPVLASTYLMPVSQQQALCSTKCSSSHSTIRSVSQSIHTLGAFELRS